MNLVIGTLELTTIGGVGTYLVTITERLQRMGHSLTILTEDSGEMAAIATERGLRVVTDPDALPDSCDVVYAQDAPSAYALATRYRDVPQAFCVHAVEHDRWVVPQLPGVVSVAVALHDRAARYARALAHVPEVIRLRQPIDIRRFAPRGPLRTPARRALVLGNYLSGDRLRIVVEACSAVGIEVVERGLQGGVFSRAPESEINDSDIVIGKSRVILEAMACGRAAYVCDYNGCDGWVTPDRYAAMEADNFDGTADPRPLQVARLREDLLAYRAEMGPTNRDLAVGHHAVRDHCESLVEVFRRIAPRSDDRAAPLDELARLTRLEWQADARALGFEHEARLLRAELARRNHDVAASREQVAQAEERAAAAGRDADREREVFERLRAEDDTLSAAHRTLAALGRPWRALRRMRRAN